MKLARWSYGISGTSWQSPKSSIFSGRPNVFTRCNRALFTQPIVRNGDVVRRSQPLDRFASVWRRHRPRGQCAHRQGKVRSRSPRATELTRFQALAHSMIAHDASDPVDGNSACPAHPKTLLRRGRLPGSGRVKAPCRRAASYRLSIWAPDGSPHSADCPR